VIKEAGLGKLGFGKGREGYEVYCIFEKID